MRAASLAALPMTVNSIRSLVLMLPYMTVPVWRPIPNSINGSPRAVPVGVNLLALDNCVQGHVQRRLAGCSFVSAAFEEEDRQ